MSRVYAIDPFHRAGLDLVAQRAELILWDDPRVADWREDADGLMVRLTPLTRADFATAKRLRAVVKQGVGVETIDLQAARDHGITVCNTPGVNSEAVAELALTLALAVGRRVPEMDRAIRGGGQVSRENFLGLEAWGRTVGIIGMGNIGTRIARKWHGAFESKILALDPYVPADHWPDIPHERLATLAEMLPRVDVLTLHLPLTEESRGMIGAAELAVMRPTAILVNTARGGIVDEAALHAALASGHLFGAGLDAFALEPPTTENPLVSLPNVVCTPHAAGGTQDTQAKSSLAVAQQLLDVLGGGEPWARVA
ncbi:NAD(P)-dependent oxidoreductase [Muricoccus radiodurans]|uniref:NAD(P)-dependent oxidoreductase n=1 Tax=Muricoccus radiodurans TaxID=2231721 RepID=UPI003CFA8049